MIVRIPLLLSLTFLGALFKRTNVSEMYADGTLQLFRPLESLAVPNVGPARKRGSGHLDRKQGGR